MNLGNDKLNQQVNDFIDKINTKLSTLDKRGTYYLLAGILIIFFLLDYFLIFYSFQLKAVQKLDPKIMGLMKDIKAAKTDVGQETQYHSQNQALKEKILTINLKVKSREEVPMILERISLVASEFNIRIDQIMPDISNQEVILKNNAGQYYSMPVLVEAKADYHNFGRFINKLENEDVYLSIADFVLSANSANIKSHIIKMTIKAVIFVPGSGV